MFLSLQVCDEHELINVAFFAFTFVGTAKTRIKGCQCEGRQMAAFDDGAGQFCAALWQDKAQFVDCQQFFCVTFMCRCYTQKHQRLQ